MKSLGKHKLISLLLTLSIIIGFVAPIELTTVVDAFDGQVVLFDMQNANLSSLAGTGSGSIPYLVKSTSTSTDFVVRNTAPKTIAVTGRGGTSQGIRLVVGDISTVANHTYKIDYTGRFPGTADASAIARIRRESDSSSLATATASGGNFAVSVTRTAQQISADSATTYSLGNSAGSIDITYTGIVVTQICPANCTANCDLISSESDVFTHITLTPGSTASQIRFAWFTPKGYSPKTAYIQYVKATDLVGGKMPASPTQITATNATGTSLHDSNKGSISGLAQNTEYAYRVGDGTDWSAIYKFKTQNTDSYSVMVIADPQLNTSSDRANDWKNTMKAAVENNPNFAFVLNAGDNTGDIDDDDLRRINNFLAPPELRSIPQATCFGNHDHNALIGGTKVLPHLFNWPNTNTAGGKGGKNYYFSYGDVLYIVLDSSDDSTTGAHKTTMDAAIASNPTAKWRIAVYHYGIYGAGYHSNRSTSNTSNLRSSWSKFMDDNKIDIVFNGHDHTYVRSKFMKGNSAVTSANQMPASFGRTNSQANAGTFVNPVGTQFFVLSSPCDVDKYGSFVNSTTTPSIIQDGSTYYPDKDATAWMSYTHHFNQPGLGLNKNMYNTMDIEGNTITFKAYWQTSATKWDIVDSITLTKKARREDLSTLVSTMSGSSAAKTAAQAVLNGPTVHDDQYHNLFISMYAANRDSHNCANPGHKCTTCGITTCGGKNCSICGTTCTVANCSVCDPSQTTATSTPKTTTPPPETTTPPTTTTPPIVAGTIYDMQSIPAADFTSLTGLGGAPSATLNLVLRRNGGAATEFTATEGSPRKVTVTGRGGSSQGLRIWANNIVALPGFSSTKTYTIEVTGRFTGTFAGVQARIRDESNNTNAWFAAPNQSNGTFTITATQTGSQIQAVAGAANSYYSIGCNGSAPFADMEITGVVIKEFGGTVTTTTPTPTTTTPTPTTTTPTPTTTTPTPTTTTPTPTTTTPTPTTTTPTPTTTTPTPTTTTPTPTTTTPTTTTPTPTTTPPVTTTLPPTPCDVCGKAICECPDFKLGYVLGNSSIGIVDAVEILKYLAGLDSVLVKKCDCVCDDWKKWNAAWNAAMVTKSNKPEIADAIEILKLIAGLPCLLKPN